MSCVSMSTLQCWRNRNQASGSAPAARANDGSVASSASHSARNSRRAAPGASRDTRATKRRGNSRMTRTRTQPGEVLEALAGDLQRLAAAAGDLVIAPRGPLLAPRGLLALPARSHEAERLEAPQRRIHGAGLQSRPVGDVEPVANAVGNRLEHEGGRVGDVTHVRCHVAGLKSI